MTFFSQKPVPLSPVKMPEEKITVWKSSFRTTEQSGPGSLKLSGKTCHKRKPSINKSKFKRRFRYLLCQLWTACRCLPSGTRRNHLRRIRKYPCLLAGLWLQCTLYRCRSSFPERACHLYSHRQRKRCLCRSIIWWKPDRTQQCLFPWYNRRRPWCRDLLDWKRPLWSSGHRRCLLENLYRAGIRWILPIRMAWKPARHCDHTAIWKKRWYSCWNRLNSHTKPWL